MRVEFVKAVQQAMQKNQNDLFFTGDLGFNAFEGLRAEFGQRFLNAGAAEQNMVSLAAGAALEGFKPWVYSIAPFVTYRCLEQTRNDVCLHNLPVRIVGNGGGYTYGIMGATHHALEEVAALKTLPNMHIYLPCTNHHVTSVVEHISKTNHPAYLRLGFSGFPSQRMPLEQNPKTLSQTYSNGNKCTVIGIGQGAQIALSALDENLISADVVAVFGIAQFPFDLESDKNILQSCLTTQNVIVVEEHYLPGSLAESLKMALPPIKKFRTLLPEYSQKHNYGNPKFQLTQAQVTPTALQKMVKQ
jgi:transketolase